ncbi:HEAT repeat domain-containing protein [Archangium gephyra]|uniref:HEAT repeat domain-containing protein n=1 Tax=Archangium gephyra TaxID=48 RepID=UPI0035D44DAF
MHVLPTLVWSSRESIRAQLVSVLHALPAEDWGSRFNALQLLAIFGGPEQLLLFREILLDVREHDAVRSRALEAGLRHGLSLPAEALSGLLQETLAEWRKHAQRTFEVLYTTDFTRLARLARTPEALSAVEAALLQVSSHQRADLLEEESREWLPPTLVDWLHARWCQEDQQALVRSHEELQHHSEQKALTSEKPYHWEFLAECAKGFTLAHNGLRANLAVAASTWERPESWAFLAGCARELTPAQLGLCLEHGLPRKELARLLAPHPEALHRAAEELLLPLSELPAWFGRDELLRRLHHIMRTTSLARRLPEGIMKEPESFPDAVELLGEWPEARPLLLRLLCDFDVHVRVRRPLLLKLFETERAVAIRWALAAMAWPDNTPLVRGVLRWAAESPEPTTDRPLFLAALRGTDSMAQCFALEGLLGLGESGAGWCDRLGALLRDPNAMVRLRAAAGLVRQGRPEALRLLQDTARTAPEPWLRAEALRWLGEVDAEASRPLLEQGLFDQGRYREDLPLTADEAVLALSRLGTPEALSALLNAHLRNAPASGIHAHLKYHLARQEAHDVEEAPLPTGRDYVPEFILRSRPVRGR